MLTLDTEACAPSTVLRAEGLPIYSVEPRQSLVAITLGLAALHSVRDLCPSQSWEVVLECRALQTLMKVYQIDSYADCNLAFIAIHEKLTTSPSNKHWL